MKITYSESADFFPKEIRKKYGLGEFAKDAKKPASKKTAAKKPAAKKPAAKK